MTREQVEDRDRLTANDIVKNWVLEPGDANAEWMKSLRVNISQAITAARAEERARFLNRPSTEIAAEMIFNAPEHLKPSKEIWKMIIDDIVAQAVAEERKRAEWLVEVCQQAHAYAKAKDEMNSHWHGKPVVYRELTVKLAEALAAYNNEGKTK